ncbi:zymogen granule membrane protein 16-like [Pangshura tecta]
MMLLQILGLTLLLLGDSAGEKERQRRHSYSGEYGSGSGTPFSYSGAAQSGPITALRVWEHWEDYLSGIQLQFAHKWANVYGAQKGTKLEVTLLPKEQITQISGKYYKYIYQLIVSTNQGRIFFFGRSYGYTFNAFPLDRAEVLAFISGHYNGASLSGLGMHWVEPKKLE